MSYAEGGRSSGQIYTWQVGGFDSYQIPNYSLKVTTSWSKHSNYVKGELDSTKYHSTGLVELPSRLSETNSPTRNLALILHIEKRIHYHAQHTCTAMLAILSQHLAKSLCCDIVFAALSNSDLRLVSQSFAIHAQSILNISTKRMLKP